MRKAARAISRLYDGALAPAGMNVGQLAILRAIGRAGPPGAPLSRLAEALVMDSTSLYRALAPLARAGWVELAAAAKGRTKIAKLTEVGRSATDSAAAHWEAAQSRIVDAFGVGRWAEVQSAVADLTAIGVRLGSQGDSNDAGS